MNKILALACIAAVALCYFFPKEEQPRYRQVYYNHIVQYGENVHDIARKYVEMHAGKDYARFVFSIKHHNGLLDGRRVEPGMMLMIPCLKRVDR